jgi:hypothetical protein
MPTTMQLLVDAGPRDKHHEVSMIQVYGYYVSAVFAATQPTCQVPNQSYDVRTDDVCLALAKKIFEVSRKWSSCVAAFCPAACRLSRQSVQPAANRRGRWRLHDALRSRKLGSLQFKDACSNPRETVEAHTAKCP